MTTTSPWPEIDVFVATIAESCYYLVPLETGLLCPGGIGILDAGDSMSVIDIVTTSGGYDCPVFVFNPRIGLPSPPVTFGAVKAMYR